MPNLINKSKETTPLGKLFAGHIFSKGFVFMEYNRAFKSQIKKKFN